MALPLAQRGARMPTTTPIELIPNKHPSEATNSASLWVDVGFYAAWLLISVMRGRREHALLHLRCLGTLQRKIEALMGREAAK